MIHPYEELSRYCWNCQLSLLRVILTLSSRHALLWQLACVISNFFGTDRQRVKPKSSVCDCRTLISCSIPRSSSELFQPLKYYSPVEEEGRWRRRRRREVNSVSFQPTPLFLVHLLLFLWFVSGATLFPLRQRLNYGRHWLSVCKVPFHFLDLNAYQQVQAVPHRPGSVLTTVDPSTGPLWLQAEGDNHTLLMLHDNESNMVWFREDTRLRCSFVHTMLHSAIVYI